MSLPRLVWSMTPSQQSFCFCFNWIIQSYFTNFVAEYYIKVRWSRERGAAVWADVGCTGTSFINAGTGYWSKLELFTQARADCSLPAVVEFFKVGPRGEERNVVNPGAASSQHWDRSVFNWQLALCKFPTFTSEIALIGRNSVGCGLDCSLPQQIFSPLSVSRSVFWTRRLSQIKHWDQLWH